MRLLALALLTAALAGCQALPDPASLPHATVAGTHVDVDGDRFDTFRLLKLDGANALPDVDQPVKLIGKDTTTIVPVGHAVRLEVEGFAFFRGTMHRIAWDAMRAQGVIEFVPVAGASYSLHGTVSPALSSIWLEDDATHQVVGAKVSVAGRDSSDPAARPRPPTRLDPNGA